MNATLALLALWLLVGWPLFERALGWLAIATVPIYSLPVPRVRLGIAPNMPGAGSVR
jgi:hypothetical protein